MKENTPPPPHSMKYEQEALGMMLLGPLGLNHAISRLETTSFYFEKHRMMFNAICSIVDEGNTVDEVGIVDLHERLKKDGNADKVGGAVYLSEVYNCVATDTRIGYVCKKLLELQRSRKLVEVSLEIERAIGNNESPESIIEEVDQQLNDIMSNKEENELIHMGKIVDPAFEKIEEMINKGEVYGLPSGYPKIDAITKGFQETDLIFLAARPGMGKTSLALNFALNVAESGKKVCVFSLEMSKDQMVHRLIGHMTGVNMRSRKQMSEKFKDIALASDRLRDLPLWISKKSNVTEIDIRSMIKKQKRNHGIDLLIIDYLQLISPTTKTQKKNSNEQTASITRSLKCLAQDVEIPIICLSQLSRQTENRPNPKPKLSDLRNSGSIEQDADMVIFIYRPDYYDRDVVDENTGMAEIIIAKQRNGSVGSKNLRFIPETCSFR